MAVPCFYDEFLLVVNLQATKPCTIHLGFVFLFSLHVFFSLSVLFGRLNSFDFLQDAVVMEGERGNVKIEKKLSLLKNEF